MLSKHEAIKALEQLPDNASSEEVCSTMERLLDADYEKDITEGLDAIEKGLGKPLDEIRAKYL